MLLGQYKKLEQNLLDGVNCRARTSLSTTTPRMRPVVTSGRKLTVNHTFSNMEAQDTQEDTRDLRSVF